MINGFRKEGDFMQIPKNIKITNATGQTVAFLSPKADGLKDCYSDTRLNGESTLEFLLPATSEKIEELTPECEIWANDRVYILRKDDAIDYIRDDKNALWAKGIAVERWKELDTSYVEPSISNDPTARPPADLAVIIVGGGSNLSGNRYATGTAGHALYAILQGTGWTLGTVDVTGIRDLEIEKTSRLGIIKQIQNIWGGYLVWDSVNKVIHLRDAGKWQPYTGFQVRYRKNLKHITRTQSNKLVTKLYPFGHDDLDIAAVNGGKKYITNHSYTSKKYIGMYKNQDIYDQEELLEKANAELELICRPRYLYKVKLVDVRVLPEYSHEDFSLGDMADIIDPDIAPDSPRPRIIRHKFNLFRPWECELDIGNPEERLIEQLKASFDTTGFIDGKFNGNGDMSGNYLEDLTVTDAKIKNLHADKITAGYISADRIEAKSITINKLNDDVAKGLNLLENTVFASFASDTNSTLGSHGTAIQQNASQISLQATSITNLGQDIARVDVKANNINLVVGRIEGNVDDLDYDMYHRYGKISIMEGEIDLRVARGDVISAINMSPERISIDANKIDLTGVTTIYSSRNSRYYTQMNGSSLIIVVDSEELSIGYDGFAGWNFDTRRGEPIRFRNSLTDFDNEVTFFGDVYYRGTVDFSRATVYGLDSNSNDAITSYYSNGWCYLDYDSRTGRIEVRNRQGSYIGDLIPN